MMRTRRVSYGAPIHNTFAVLQMRGMYASMMVVFKDKNIRQFYWFTESFPYTLRDTIREVRDMYPK